MSFDDDLYDVEFNVLLALGITYDEFLSLDFDKRQEAMEGYRRTTAMLDEIFAMFDDVSDMIDDKPDAKVKKLVKKNR